MFGVRSGIDRSAAQLSGLRTSTTYVWRVRGTTDGGTGPWSAYHRMQTQKMSKVEDAVRLPADGDTARVVTGGTQTFSWAPVPDATRYRMQVTEAGNEQLSWSNGYANAHLDTTITATSIDLARDRLTNGATSTQPVEWRIRAQHDWGQGVQGSSWTLPNSSADHRTTQAITVMAELVKPWSRPPRGAIT